MKLPSTAFARAAIVAAIVGAAIVGPVGPASAED